MRIGRWLFVLGTLLCLTLFVGQGVATAETAGGEGSTSSGASSSSSSTAGSRSDSASTGSAASGTSTSPGASPQATSAPGAAGATGAAKGTTRGKPAATPDLKPRTKPATAPNTAPDTEPDTEPAATPSEPDPNSEPAAEPAANPVAQPTSKPVAKPTSKPVAKPTVTPQTNTAASPVADTAPVTSREPTASPAHQATPTPETATEPAATEPAATEPAAAQAAALDPVAAEPVTKLGAKPVVKPVTTATAPPQPTLLNIVGTILFNLVTAPLKLLEKAPVIPPGSTVTVGRSTLDIGCGCGQSVDARWYFPNQADPPRSVVFLSHGFLRSNSAMSAMAVQMAQQTNSVVVTPTLTSNPFATGGCWISGQPMQQAVANLFVGDREALTASAAAAGWTGGALPTKFVLSGHSAGGGLAAAAAGYTVDNGAVSDLLMVVMLDGVPSGDALTAALAKLDGADYRKVYQIAARPYAWNANGIGVTQLEAARPGEFVGVRLDGGSHVDAEGASSDFLAQLACGFSLPQNVAAVQDIATGWINDAIDGTSNGVYGTPGQTLTIPTAAGPATGVALGSQVPAAVGMVAV